MSAVRERPTASADVDVEASADPTISTHRGSEQEPDVVAGGPVTTLRDTTVVPESPVSADAAHGEAIIAPAPNATANAPTRPTYLAPLTATTPPQSAAGSPQRIKSSMDAFYAKES
jgi:hypothetical protein